MAVFTTTRLVNNRVMVAGEDARGNKGQMTVDSTEWDEVCADQAFSRATADFDAAVESFFAPLTEAAEKVASTYAKPVDPAGYVVLAEGVEGQPAQPEQLVKLSTDSIILRLIDEDQTDRLVWVSEDQLDVLEFSPATA